MQGVLAVHCPTVLFPYIRETLADAVTRAGFPPVHLAPINFEALYQQQLAQAVPAAARGRRTDAEPMRTARKRRCGALACGARGALAVRAAPGVAAAEFRSASEAATVLYDAPSAEGEAAVRASAAIRRSRSSSPLEGWIKVRDAGGTIGWVERKALTDRRTLVVRVAGRRGASRRRTPPAPLVFRAEQNVAARAGASRAYRRAPRRARVGRRCSTATDRPATFASRRSSGSVARVVLRRVSMSDTVAIVGAGAWGTALAAHLARRPRLPVHAVGARSRRRPRAIVAAARDERPISSRHRAARCARVVTATCAAAARRRSADRRRRRSAALPGRRAELAARRCARAAGLAVARAARSPASRAAAGVALAHQVAGADAGRRRWA